MRQPPKDLKSKLNLKVKDSTQKSNNFEVNSVSSNEDNTNDFNMPTGVDIVSKKPDKNRTSKQQLQSNSSSDINPVLDGGGINNLKSFRMRKLSKESFLAPVNLANQSKPNILPTPKNYHANKINTKKKTNAEAFNSSSMSEMQFVQNYNKIGENSNSTGKLSELDGVTNNKSTKSKTKNNAPPKSIDVNLLNQNSNVSNNTSTSPNNYNNNSHNDGESNDGNFIKKLSMSNKDKLNLPPITKDTLETAGTFQRSLKIPLITPNKPSLKNKTNTSSILSFNLQPIKVAALNKLQSTSELIASNLTPALDNLFFPKIYSPSLASSKNTEKNKLHKNYNSSSFFNFKSNAFKIDVPQEDFEDVDLNSILYSDAPDFFVNDYPRARLSKINEEPSGKNTQLSQNWSTWSGISSALSEIENHNIISEEIQKKTNKSMMQLTRPIHQRSKTFYNFENAYA
jgi:hypothetical protein